MWTSEVEEKLTSKQISLCRLFDRMCVNFGVAACVIRFDICVRDCIILLICFAGGVAGSLSISRDRQGHQNLNFFL